MRLLQNSFRGRAGSWHRRYWCCPPAPSPLGKNKKWNNNIVQRPRTPSFVFCLENSKQNNQINKGMFCSGASQSQGSGQEADAGLTGVLINVIFQHEKAIQALWCAVLESTVISPRAPTWPEPALFQCKDFQKVCFVCWHFNREDRMCVAQNKYSGLRSLGGGGLSSPPGQLKLCSRLFGVIMQLGRTSTSNWFANTWLIKIIWSSFWLRKFIT